MQYLGMYDLSGAMLCIPIFHYTASWNMYRVLRRSFVYVYPPLGRSISDIKLG
jgi:hypothetical protein